VPLDEPTTLVSDWVLAAVAVALACRLHRSGPGRRPQRLWAAAFLAAATAAFAGGAVHGFAASLLPVAHDVLWKVVLVGSGLAGGLILAGTVLASVDRSWRAALLAVAATQLAAYLGLVSSSDDIRLAVGNGAVTIVVLLALVLATASHDGRRLGWILLALGFSAAGLVAQRTGLTAAILNHNDVCHVLQTAALWPFYRAGLRLRERGPFKAPGR
jgi:hypothetical protein